MTPQPSKRMSLHARIMRGLAVLGAGSVVAGIGLHALPDAARAETTPVNGVNLSWQVNEETGGGAFYGGCHFLSAGTVGDAGSSRVWSADDASQLYRTSSGNVTITKPDASGKHVEPTWETRCKDANGNTVNGRPGSTTGNRVNISGGTGQIDPATGDGTIQWQGSFSIVYYGGMTYWSITNPKLELKGGTGRLTGTASGIGADMEDPSRWEVIPTRDIDLATISNPVSLKAGVTQIDTDYAGVRISGNSNLAPQDTSGAGWGSFPQSWVDYNVLTGQSSYWYHSGAPADPKKQSKPLIVTIPETTVASVDAGTVVRGSTNGVGITVTGIPDGTRGQLVARAGGVELAPLPGQSGSVTGPSFAGRFDTSSLPVGTHEITFAVRGSGGDESLLAISDPVSVRVVDPLGKTPPSLLRPTPTARSIQVNWAWPNSAQGKPTNYLVRVSQPGTATPVAQRVVQAEDGAMSVTLTEGIVPSRDYVVSVTPRAGDSEGTSATEKVRTLDEEKNPTPGTSTPGSGGGANPAADGATMYWGLNAESSSGAFYGGCNFLSAGRSGNSGRAAAWDGKLYKPTDGNVSIVKPQGDQLVEATWETRCTDRNGERVTTSRRGANTESMVKLTGGQVTKKPNGDIRVQWKGSFTVAYYGGMSYWSATDPVLEISSKGGRLTATASGYGAAMDDPSKWVELKPRSVTLANLSSLQAAQVAADNGFALTPDYVGVAYGGNSTAQGLAGGDETSVTGQARRTSANEEYWGSFPTDFVDFQKETGQFSYWFTSGGVRDQYKPASTITVALNGDRAPEVGPYTAAPGSGSTTANGGTSPSVPGRGPGSQGSGSNANPATARPAPSRGGGLTDSLDAFAEAITGGAYSRQSTAEGGEPVHPARFMMAGGVGMLGVVALDWIAFTLIRRRLGLDPAMFV